MIESIDTSLIDWSRAQFALTAMYHWIFVPLTLGLAVVMAIMETLYYKTGNEFWKRTAKFWMKLFGINFADFDYLTRPIQLVQAFVRRPIFIPFAADSPTAIICKYQSEINLR